MSLIQSLIDKIRRKKSPPVIMTEFGPVSEVARKQAAMNMREDPAIFIRVEQIILRECGGDWVRTKKEMRRRYPESIPEGY